jgi:uncharacterized membrane protein
MRLLALWLHLLALVAWLGGLLFQSHILLPLAGTAAGLDAAARAVRRFRRVAWAAIALLVASGIYNLTRLLPALQASQGAVPRLLALKLFLVVVVVMLAAHRDFGLASRLLRDVAAGRGGEQVLRRIAWLDRIVLLLGVILLYLGLAVSRGGIG